MTTPTGIPIIDCAVCDKRHPETRGHCDSCAEPTLFLSPQNECYDCAQHDPTERAAIALFDVAKLSIGWPSKQWDDPVLDQVDRARENFRDRARTALTAAINERELAQHIGTIAAQTVTTHLLGSAYTPPK